MLELLQETTKTVERKKSVLRTLSRGKKNYLKLVFETQGHNYRL